MAATASFVGFCTTTFLARLLFYNILIFSGLYCEVLYESLYFCYLLYYYKAHPELTYEERTKLNYDHPQAFDTQMLVDHIKALKDNVPIEHPVYSFVDHDRTAETVCVKPSKVIIVDGILIFENKELRDMMDIKVYVDTDADIRLARRILRDVCERGPRLKELYTLHQAIFQ